MIQIDNMFIAPVKALGMTELSHAMLDKAGIAGDRAFYIVDVDGKLITQREYGPLAKVRAAYDVATEVLTLTFPDGSNVTGVPGLGDALTTSFFGVNPVDGHVVEGDWGSALSEFAGQPLRIVKADIPGRGFDGFPLSMCSRESLVAFAQAAGRPGDDGRRFRQNIYMSGCASHEEDTWIGREVRVGNALLRVKMPDSRCVVTTLSPDTGEPEVDTLQIIAGYRTDQPKQVNFGVYCTVVEPGEASIRDEVAVV